MSGRIGNVVFICPQADETCELCGAKEECRPYGPNGENICYGCGMQDEAATARKMKQVLFGDKEDSHG